LVRTKTTYDHTLRINLKNLVHKIIKEIFLFYIISVYIIYYQKTR